MSASSFNRFFHFAELNEPLDTQEGVLSPSVRKARARDNLGTVTGASNGIVVSTVYTVATAPAAGDNTGLVIVVTNGAAGAPTIARSDGTNWVRLDGAGGNISAT